MGFNWGFKGLIRGQVQSPYFILQIPFVTPRRYFAARMCGRSVGYVNTISESTESNKQYLSDKIITLYKLGMVM